MTLNNKIISIAFLLTAAFLSGCNNDINKQIENNSIDKDYLIDPIGEEINTENMAYDQENNTYTTYDYVYLTTSDGIAYNSLSDPEQFVSPEKQGEVYNDLVVKISDKDYKRSVKNLRFSDLTLTDVCTVYYPQWDEKHYNIGASIAKFEGELQLNGWLYIFDDNKNNPKAPGDMIFLPDKGEWADLPLIYGCLATAWLFSQDFLYISDAPILYLGNISDYDIALLGALDIDSEIYCSVNVTNICLNGMDPDWGKSTYSAYINDISCG